MQTIDEKRQLKPPLKPRSTVPHVCATCRFHRIEDDSWSHCTRPDGLDFGDAGDMRQWFSTCDRWASEFG